MTTAEMERRLVLALRSADGVPVAVVTARERLMRHGTERRHVTRRFLVAAVAAAVFAAGLTVALVVRLVDPGPRVLPAHEVTVSPSGLPVGALRAEVMLPTESRVDETRRGPKVVWIVVRPDGTGSYLHSGLIEGIPFELTIRPDGQGRAVFGYAGPVCADPNELTLEFRVQAHTVTVEDAIPGSGACVVRAEDAAAFRGVTFEVLPLPADRGQGGPGGR